MASVTIKSNISSVVGRIKAKFDKLNDKEYLLRPVCSGLIDLMTKRIHTDGQASDGGQIGIYSKGYLAVREKKYKRGGDPKVIISLTRQLENDWSAIATERGYGIGFLKLLNYNKSQWVQETYNKKIFKMTVAEHQYAIDYINDLAKRIAND